MMRLCWLSVQYVGFVDSLFISTIHLMRRESLSPSCLSTNDRLILLGHIPATQCVNRPEREREIEVDSRIFIVPMLKPIINKQCDPLAAAEILTRLLAQLERPTDCWPTLELEINSLFSLMRENMQTSRRARRYAKSWHEDRRWRACGGVLLLHDWLRRGPSQAGGPTHPSLHAFLLPHEHVLRGLRRNITVSPPYSSFLSWLSFSQSGSTA